DPSLLLHYVSQQASDRKLRLLVCQSVASLAAYFTDPRSQQAAEACQHYLDGQIGKKKLTAARRQAFDATRGFRDHPRYNALGVEGDPAAALAYYAAWASLRAAAEDFSREPHSAIQVLGNAASVAYCLGGSAAQHAKWNEQVRLIRH